MEVPPPTSGNCTNRSSWSAQEDATLREARTQPKWTWKGIASQLPGRSTGMASERWMRLEKGQQLSNRWSAQEDATLREARTQPKWTWKGIASQLPG
jgi:hypothetical protein